MRHGRGGQMPGPCDLSWASCLLADIFEGDSLLSDTRPGKRRVFTKLRPLCHSLGARQLAAGLVHARVFAPVSKGSFLERLRSANHAACIPIKPRIGSFLRRLRSANRVAPTPWFLHPRPRSACGPLLGRSSPPIPPLPVSACFSARLAPISPCASAVQSYTLVPDALPCATGYLRSWHCDNAEEYPPHPVSADVITGPYSPPVTHSGSCGGNITTAANPGITTQRNIHHRH